MVWYLRLVRSGDGTPEGWRARSKSGANERHEMETEGSRGRKQHVSADSGLGSLRGRGTDWLAGCRPAFGSSDYLNTLAI